MSEKLDLLTPRQNAALERNEGASLVRADAGSGDPIRREGLGLVIWFICLILIILSPLASLMVMIGVTAGDVPVSLTFATILFLSGHALSAALSIGAGVKLARDRTPLGLKVAIVMICAETAIDVAVTISSPTFALRSLVIGTLMVLYLTKSGHAKFIYQVGRDA